MNFSSVSGKNWLLKKFDSSHVAKLVENYSLSEIAAKLLSIRKNNIENIDLFLNPKICKLSGYEMVHHNNPSASNHGGGALGVLGLPGR